MCALESTGGGRAGGGGKGEGAVGNPGERNINSSQGMIQADRHRTVCIYLSDTAAIIPQSQHTYVRASKLGESYLVI